MEPYNISRTYKLTKTDLGNGFVCYRLVNRETGEVVRDYSHTPIDSWTAVTVHCTPRFFENPKTITRIRDEFGRLYRLYLARATDPDKSPEFRRKYEEKFRWLTELAVLED